MTKVRPILFSAPMVRGLLDGRKTQTRRVIPVRQWKRDMVNLADFYQRDDFPEEDQFFSRKFNDPHSWGWPHIIEYDPVSVHELICKFGIPGDLLWVRETWALASRATDLAKVYYRAHENKSHTEFHKLIDVKKIGNEGCTWPRWKPSIFMPRWASRITLEITNVRVERLQDCSEDDAQAEGCDPMIEHSHASHERGNQFYYAKGYENLWNKINGKGSWDTNPWVWVLEFKVLDENVDSILGVAA